MQEQQQITTTKKLPVSIWVAIGVSLAIMATAFVLSVTTDDDEYGK